LSLHRNTKIAQVREQSGLPVVLVDVVSEAVGHSRRNDPVVAGSGGPAGNARLTAWTGILLLALSLAELLTLFDVRGFISWHIVIGVLLIPPALLKTASTGWRIVRYYTRDSNYVTAGPPPMLLRLLGPAVVVSTLAVLGSGLALVVLGDRTSQSVIISALALRVNAVTIHQVMFAVWAVVTGLHVLARLLPALRLTIVPPRNAQTVPGASRRWAILVAITVVAGVAAPFVLLAAGSWQSDDHRPDGHPRPAAHPR
jgi:hypothetical protein